MRRGKAFGKMRLVVGLALTLVIAAGQLLPTAFALSQAQLNVLSSGIYYFNTALDPALCSTSVNLTGSDNITKIWNYFTGQGLSAAATAGILGNMKAESHFNATIEQNPGAWEDMSTNNVNNGGKGGVGLVQWDGGRRPAVIKYMESQGLTDADFHTPSDKLLSAELSYIWQELSGPYKTSTLDRLQDPSQVPNTADGAGQAAYIFHKYYEISNDTKDRIQSNRVDPAIQYFNQYSGVAAASSGNTTTSSCGGASTSPDCGSAQGSAKILCAAQKYKGIYYEWGGGHQSYSAFKEACPDPTNPPNNQPHGGPVNGDPAGTSGNPSPCGLDCSGLVNVAVGDAFGVNLQENTSSERSDTKNWQKVDLSQVQPGDLIQPDSGHVEIVDHVTGNRVYTFGSHYTGVAIGPDNYPVTSENVYLHYIGPGST